MIRYCLSPSSPTVVVASLSSGHEIVFSESGFGGGFPVDKYGVRLPSGMTHGFESESAARASAYWPSK